MLSDIANGSATETLTIAQGFSEVIAHAMIHRDDIALKDTREALSDRKERLSALLLHDLTSESRTNVARALAVTESMLETIRHGLNYIGQIAREQHDREHQYHPDDDVMQYVDDQSDDADALASAGFGTDEDYGYAEDLGDW